MDKSNYKVNKGVKIVGSDFTIVDDDSNVTLGNLNITTGNYQPRQRYAFEVAGNTPVGTGITKLANITVSVDGTP